MIIVIRYLIQTNIILKKLSFLSESTLIFLNLFSHGNMFKRYSLKETIVTEVDEPSDTDSTC